MSTHVIENDKIRWIFGWNQKNRSFFLTKYDKSEDKENPVFRVGIRPYEIPDADGLFALAWMAGLAIPDEFRVLLYQKKDYEETAYFVLHYPDEFVAGFETDSLAHAELLKEAFAPARPDQELQIRRIMKYST